LEAILYYEQQVGRVFGDLLIKARKIPYYVASIHFSFYISVTLSMPPTPPLRPKLLINFNAFLPIRHRNVNPNLCLSVPSGLME
jgi:hypothetical protein